MEIEDYKNRNRSTERKRGEIECVVEKKCMDTTQDIWAMRVITGGWLTVCVDAVVEDGDS